MKRIIVYGLLIYLVFVAPVRKADIGKLEPVEVVYVNEENGNVYLKTDTGAEGYGKSIEEALANLKQTTAGVVYLDTAEFLLLAENAKCHIEELRSVLSDSVKVCYSEGMLNLKDAAKYLSVHKDLPLLRDWKTEKELPLLTCKK